MSFILDASVTLAWCFIEETTPTAIKLFDKLEKETAYVPSIWFANRVSERLLL